MDVLVHEGIFAVPLDFGANAFNNSMRWLEISVDGVILAPRQAITRTPYALQTRGIFVNEDLQVGIGTTDLQDHQVTIFSTTTGDAIRVSTNTVAATTIRAIQRAQTGTGAALVGGSTSADGYAGFFIGGRNYFEGNVGIGNPDPAVRLSIFGNGSTPPLELVAGSTSEHMRLSPRDSTPEGATEGDIYSHANGTIYYRSNTAWTAMNVAADFSELILPIHSQLEAHDGTGFYEGEISFSEIITINDNGHYQRCDTPYDARISGIESGDRGRFYLPQGSREREEGQRQFGIMGHVKLKVSAENGPIRAGDLITCSASLPGVGMKATRSGRVVGIAKGDFTGAPGDLGLIEVYVNPHTWMAESTAEMEVSETDIAALKNEVLALQVENASLIERLNRIEQLIHQRP
jgi:hypothetical protein